MIVLQASDALKAVFEKTIQVMGQNVAWDKTFGFNNNTLILPGSLKSLLFSFDNRKVIGTVLEEGLNAEVKPMPEGRLLENAVNMVLYAFGKWGQIKGLTVEKNYSQLNALMNGILREVDVEAQIGQENCRFYKEGVRITYEEVIELILEYLEPQAPAEDGQEQEESAAAASGGWREQVRLGLWHKLVWQAGNSDFTKQEISRQQRQQSRIGQEFYMTGYLCPECHSPLHMTVYPEDREFTVETNIGRVILSRVYACSTCKCFYTPQPDRMLMDGSILKMDFEGDENAYQDYLELLGRNGEKTSNSHLNRFENSTVNRENGAVPDAEQLSQMFEHIDEIPDIELFNTVDKMDSGFYPDVQTEKYIKAAEQEMARRQMERNIPPDGYRTRFSGKTGNDVKRKIQPADDANKKVGQQSAGTGDDHGSAASANQDDGHLSRAIRYAQEQDMDAFAQQLELLEADGLKRLMSVLEERKAQDTEKKGNWTEYAARARAKLLQHQQKELLKIAFDAKKRGYPEMKQAYDSIMQKDCPNDTKSSVLASLDKWMKERAKNDLDIYMENMPDPIGRKQYLRYRQIFEEYGNDAQPYIEKLDLKRDVIEQSELNAFIRKNNRQLKNRTALLELADAVEKMDYEERNKQPFADQLRQKVYDLDLAAIEKICPHVQELEFDEGLKVHKRISEGNFLPELKEDILARIEKRLEAIKKDECSSLVSKLIRDTDWQDGDIEHMYMYDVRRMSNDACDDTDAIIFHNAIYNYASERPYEYPLLVYDATKGENGKKGFLLTPDRLCYNTSTLSGSLKISEIKAFSIESGLFNKGIYVTNSNNHSIRIAGYNKAEKAVLEDYLKKLNRFIKYLKEKPESRNLEYLVREKHDVKCCFRCGYVYREGDVCPKCGSRNNT